MKIVVCVKQVRIVAARSAFAAAAPGQLAPGALVHALNPFDEAAVEDALRLRGAHGGGDVTVVSGGPPRAAEALRRCLAAGADHAIHVVDRSPRADDPWAVSRALAAVARRIGFDLILCGRVAVDDGMGVVGTYLAELLGLPVVTGVVAITLRPEDRAASLQRALGRGHRECVACPLPAVVTVERALNRPRYPTLAGRRRAEREEIVTVDSGGAGEDHADGDGMPFLEIVRLAPPKIRPRKILAPDENSSAAGRLQWVLSAGRQRKGGTQVVGDPAGLVDGIVDFLRERRLLPGSTRSGSLPPPRPSRSNS